MTSGHPFVLALEPHLPLAGADASLQCMGAHRAGPAHQVLAQRPPEAVNDLGAAADLERLPTRQDMLEILREEWRPERALGCGLRDTMI